MKVGELRDRVVIHPLTSTPKSTGGFTETWGTSLVAGGVWAKVHDASGDERFRGMQQEQASQYEVTVRYRSDILVTARVTLSANWGSKTLRIKSLRPLDDGKKRFLLITGEVLSEAS